MLHDTNRSRFLDHSLRWMLCLLLLAGISPLVVQAQDGSPTFDEVVKTNFAKWTRQGQTLSSERVNQLIASSDIKGAEAAAIASIHCYQRKMKGEAQPATLNFLTAPRQENASLRRDQPGSGGNLTLNYKGFLAHINSTTRKLFAIEKLSLNGMKQGHLGDCYFISGVGTAVHHNSAHIRSLFHPRPDGSCDVIFPTGQKVHIPVLTDSQIALGSSAGEQGLWLNVLEVAAGMIEQEHGPNAKKPVLDRLGEGGDSIFTIELLTGHKATKLRIRSITNEGRLAPKEGEVNMLTNKIGDELKTAFAHGRIVCCGVGNWKVPPGMASHHQYGVLGFENGKVNLWNPWGGDYHFEPKGTPGLENGYPTQHGQFKIPIHDFVQIFGGLNIETAQPVH